jgi:hypothetical protein
MSKESFPEIEMDLNNLYREEVYTDQKVGTVRILTPVTVDGEVDTSRSVQYLGQTQVLTPAGALPLNFELEGDSLKEALEGFAKGAKEAMERTMEEIREMRRQQASSIVLPGDAAAATSKIQLP